MSVPSDWSRVTFLIDSGAGQCLCCSSSAFSDMSPCYVVITGVSGLSPESPGCCRSTVVVRLWNMGVFMQSETGIEIFQPEYRPWPQLHEGDAVSVRFYERLERNKNRDMAELNAFTSRADVLRYTQYTGVEKTTSPVWQRNMTSADSILSQTGYNCVIDLFVLVIR
jgi:hypothetical protein